ncbi:Phospholipid-transporting ATPase [Vigna angularis]|uniref:Phospholipid-transporting ATPase n=1 Tax=Phaseolus angularis TaxID=3914 RepID=A0A8T0JTZ9_PHAAN|nr:Phospholipid-transporting ATPase [Vigna angularis]
MYEDTSTSLTDRAAKLHQMGALIECNLKLLGPTGIEDELLEGAPEVTESVWQAEVKVWVLTGYKQETEWRYAADNYKWHCRVWSTGTATSSRQVRLHLYDTGNLVLLEDSSDSAVLWQSFDFPTNTLLPNQPLSGSTNLVSSRSRSNHSSGFYRLFFDFENVLRLMYQGPRVSSVFWPYAWLQSNNFGNGNGRSTFNDSRIAVLDELGGVLSSDNYTYRTID